MASYHVPSGTAPGHRGERSQADTHAMRFNVLGPLEVVVGSTQVPLRGIKQRAALGFLLLHANKVVATSQLIRSLWHDNAPPTARKMLQNAIAGVRAVLSGDPAAQPAQLLTHPPGYLLKVVPERVDLCRFQRLAEAGRARLAAGDWEAAARTLREALALWRGPVLADLTETGIAWPELDGVLNARLAALEDYAEAELAMHHYQEVITQLDAALTDSSQLPRERLASQLMIALYRSGRQADALGVYQRTRSALREQLGLDPSRELQELERAILRQDPVLTPLRTAPPAAPVRVRGTAQPSAPEEPAPNPADPPQDLPPPTAVPEVTSERKIISVLLLRASIDNASGQHDPEDLREAWQKLTGMIERVASQFEGVRWEAAGLLWTILFGVPRTREDDIERAVRAGLELQRCLTAPSREGRTAVRLIPQIAVATGEALVTCQRYGDEIQTDVTSGVFDACLRLLTMVPAGQMRVCSTTRAGSSQAFEYAEQADPSGGWLVHGIRQEDGAHPFTLPFLERSQELQLLHSLLRDVRRQGHPYLATVLGEPGIGKSRLIAEFCQSVDQTGAARCVTARTPSFGQDPPHEVVLGEIVRSLTAEPGTASAAAGPPPPTAGTGVCAASRRLIERAAAQGPLVVVFEDVHRADGTLLDFVEDLTFHAGSLPLLVIATARPELLERRPYWGGGKRSAMTITLHPLSHSAIQQLLDCLWDQLTARLGGEPGGHLPAPRGATRFPPQLVERVGGNPLFAAEFVRCLHARGQLPSAWSGGRSEPAQETDLAEDLSLPLKVRQVIAARLDTLLPKAKAMLQDIAVFGTEVCAATAAAMSGLQPAEVAAHLKYLERRDFLRRSPHQQPDGSIEYTYTFRHAAVRDVAYTQLPRNTRADKHYRAAAWLETRMPGASALLAHHYHQAAELSKAAQRPVGRMITERVRELQSRRPRRSAQRAPDRYRLAVSGSHALSCRAVVELP